VYCITSKMDVVRENVNSRTSMCWHIPLHIQSVFLQIVSPRGWVTNKKITYVLVIQ